MRDTSRWLGPAAVALAVVALAWNAWSTWPSVVDDAYISARYAAQLAAGHGLVYNAGEPPVEGYSNPLWTILLALLLKAGVPALPAMTSMGFAFAALSLPFVLGLTRRLAGTEDLRTLAPVWMVALSPHLGAACTNGLESSQMLCVVLVALWAFVALEDRPALAGTLAGLVAWTRPEGMAVTALLSGFAVLEAWRPGSAPRRPLLPYLASAVGLVAVLLLGRFALYGRWLPNTYDAKSSFPITETWEVNDQYLIPEAWPLGLAVAALIVGTLASRWTWRTALLSSVAVVLAAIQLSVNLWMPALRYFLAPMGIAAILLGVAVTRLPRVVGALVAIALVGATAGAQITSGPRVRGYDRRHTVQPGNPAQRAAEHLARHLPAGAVLATRDAGVLAYFVGPDIAVAELHHRALTQLHPGGADADVRSYTPANPEAFVGTVQRDHADKLAYGNDRKVFERLSVPYAYLGRVEQHHHRYYDVYVRADLGVPPLPETIVTNFAGPKPKLKGEPGPTRPASALPDTGEP
jgi:hypothetical protein